MAVKVVPGASRTRCAGVLGERVKIAVAAAAEKGQANAELVAYLAKLVGVRRRDVTLVEGRTSPQKVIRIQNTTCERVREALGLAGG